MTRRWQPCCWATSEGLDKGHTVPLYRCRIRIRGLLQVYRLSQQSSGATFSRSSVEAGVVPKEGWNGWDCCRLLSKRIQSERSHQTVQAFVKLWRQGKLFAEKETLLRTSNVMPQVCLCRIRLQRSPATALTAWWSTTIKLASSAPWDKHGSEARCKTEQYFTGKLSRNIKKQQRIQMTAAMKILPTNLMNINEACWIEIFSRGKGNGIGCAGGVLCSMVRPLQGTEFGASPAFCCAIVMVDWIYTS